MNWFFTRSKRQRRRRELNTRRPGARARAAPGAGGAGAGRGPGVVARHPGGRRCHGLEPGDGRTATLPGPGRARQTVGAAPAAPPGGAGRRARGPRCGMFTSAWPSWKARTSPACASRSPIPRCHTACSTWIGRSPSPPTTWPSSASPSTPSPEISQPAPPDRGLDWVVDGRTLASTSACEFVAQAQRLGAGQFPWSRQGCPAASRPEPYGRRLRRRP